MREVGLGDARRALADVQDVLVGELVAWQVLVVLDVREETVYSTHTHTPHDTHGVRLRRGGDVECETSVLVGGVAQLELVGALEGGGDALVGP